MALDKDTLSQFLDALDRFVKERLIPYEDRVADEDVIPPMLVDEIRMMGLFGMSIPEDFGGLGLSMIEEVQAAFVLGFACVPVASWHQQRDRLSGNHHRWNRRAEGAVSTSSRVRRYDRILRPNRARCWVGCWQSAHYGAA